MIEISNRQRDLSISTASVRAFTRTLLDFQKISKRVSICLVTETKIKALHSQFFNNPTPTDCITFPLQGEILGEIIICPKTALLYAKEHGLDPYEETGLYLVHGILHLLGEDDLEPAAKRRMRQKEKKCMAHLKAKRVFLKPL